MWGFAPPPQPHQQMGPGQPMHPQGFGSQDAYQQMLNQRLQERNNMFYNPQVIQVSSEQISVNIPATYLQRVDK